MSVQAQILSLLGDIDDPRVRVDISATINYLKEVYMSGKISAETLEQELRDVVSTVLDITHPELLPDEKKKKVDNYVKQLVKAIKLETVRIRMMRKHTPIEF